MVHQTTATAAATSSRLTMKRAGNPVGQFDDARLLGRRPLHQADDRR
jgi:hypothetical protein